MLLFTAFFSVVSLSQVLSGGSSHSEAHIGLRRPPLPRFGEDRREISAADEEADQPNWARPRVGRDVLTELRSVPLPRLGYRNLPAESQSLAYDERAVPLPRFGRDESEIEMALNEIASRNGELPANVEGLFQLIHDRNKLFRAQEERNGVPAEKRSELSLSRTGRSLPSESEKRGSRMSMLRLGRSGANDQQPDKRNGLSLLRMGRSVPEEKRAGMNLLRMGRSLTDTDDKRSGMNLLRMGKRGGMGLLRMGKRSDMSLLRMGKRDGMGLLRMGKRDGMGLLRMGKRGGMGLLRMGKRSGMNLLRMGKREEPSET